MLLFNNQSRGVPYHWRGLRLIHIIWKQTQKDERYSYNVFCSLSFSFGCRNESLYTVSSCDTKTWCFTIDATDRCCLSYLNPPQTLPNTSAPSFIFLYSLCALYHLLFTISHPIFFLSGSSPCSPYTLHCSPAPPATATNGLCWDWEEETALPHCRPCDLQLNWACCWLVTSRDMLISTDLLFEFSITALDCFPVGGENGIIPLGAVANSHIHGHWVSKDPSQN